MSVQYSDPYITYSSAFAFFSGLEQPPPMPPTFINAGALDSSAIVFFSGASGGPESIVSYTVTSSPGGMVATGTNSPVTVYGLTNGTSYTFTVVTNNYDTSSISSGPSNAVIPFTQLPVGSYTGQNKNGALSFLSFTYGNS